MAYEITRTAPTPGSTSYPEYFAELDGVVRDIGDGLTAVEALPRVTWTSGTTRPTPDPTVLCVFVGADPGSAALTGDIWVTS